MARAKQSSSTIACAGMAAGMLLLSFAAILVVMTPSSMVTEIQQQGTAIVSQHARHFLGGSSRRMESVEAETDRLQAEEAAAVAGTPAQTGITAQDVLNGAPAFVPTVTTTRTYTTHKSVLDSMDKVGSGSSGSMMEAFKSSESQSSLEMDYEAEQAVAVSIPWWFSTMVSLGISLCYAVCYHQCAMEPILDEYGTLADKETMNEDEFERGYTGKTDDFKNPICGCLGDFWVAVHTILCPIVRLAHTNAVADVCGYWESMICFSLCACVTGGIIGPGCLLVHWRKRVKEAMGLEHHCWNDCFLTFVCPYLSLCQQATAVDRKMGYVVTGCCDVTPTGY